MKRIITNKLTQNRTQLRRKIKYSITGGATYMMDAIKTAYEEILMEGRASPVMVIATDGQPTDASEEEILEYATPIKWDGFQIITISIGNDVNEDFLKRLASTNKDYQFAKASFERKKIYKKVAAGLAVREEVPKKRGEENEIL